MDSSRTTTPLPADAAELIDSAQAVARSFAKRCSHEAAEHKRLRAAIQRFCRADKAWALCQGSDLKVQTEMDEATYALHEIALEDR